MGDEKEKGVVFMITTPAPKLATMKQKYLNLSTRTPKQMRRDIGYLLSLLESHPASEPPKDNRDVITRNSSGAHLGHYDCEWWIYDIGGFGIGTVDTWQELPPEVTE